MSFFWNAEKIRFLRDASEQVGFNDVLAAKAAAYLPPNPHVCDAGCGLGYLSLALAPFCQKITAVDNDHEALAVLRHNLALSDAANIEVIESSIFELPPQLQFDAMVFCFFGNSQQVLDCLQKHCRGKAILFKKDWDRHRFSLRPRPLERFTFKDSCEELRSLGVSFESQTFNVEMGQPFRSLGDAVAFFRLHGRDESINPEDIIPYLTATDDPTFPYYLTSNLPVGMIVLDAGQFPDTINTK